MFTGSFEEFLEEIGIDKKEIVPISFYFDGEKWIVRDRHPVTYEILDWE